MLYLIEYDRQSGRIVTFEQFENRAAVDAQEARLALEQRLNREGVDREVVLLEASNEAALRRTHRRYFEDLAELANGGGD